MILSPRMKWKINRYGRTLEERLEQTKSFFKSVTYKQKVCPACRALVDRKDVRCPFCGEVTATAPSGAVDRLLARVMPAQARYSTLFLIANLAIFGLVLAASARRRGEFDLPMLLGSVDSSTMVHMGAKYGPLLSTGEWWRFVTAVFVHGSIIHLAFNSIVLFDLGPSVEQIYGSHRFVVLYVVTGAAGFALSYFWHPYAIGAGASGALLGLIGAMIAYSHRHRETLGETLKSMYARWAIYILIFSFLLPGVDHAAHIGGLVTGILLGLIVSDMPSLTVESICFWRALHAASLLLVIFGFAMVALRHAAA